MSGFSNNDSNTVCGASASCTIIAGACLNLPPHLRYKPENMSLAGIIPGPDEPHLTELNHHMRPHVCDFPLLNTETPEVASSSSCNRVLEISRQHQARRNTLSQENKALRRKLAYISNDNDNDGDHSEGSAHRSKRQRTAILHPLTLIMKMKPWTTPAQVRPTRRMSSSTMQDVRKGTDIFKMKLDDTYDSSQRFENDDNKV